MLASLGGWVECKERFREFSKQNVLLAFPFLLVLHRGEFVELSGWLLFTFTAAVAVARENAFFSFTFSFSISTAAAESAKVEV
jgi:hypothetical protein